MATANITNILNILKDHERRILSLEDKNTSTRMANPTTKIQQKQITITELIKGKEFKSGQEKITIIVGFCEKILKMQSIKESDIKTNWIKGKFDGKYRSNILGRASRDGLIRDLENGTYDLSQTGEKFFEEFIKRDDKQDQAGAK